MVPLWCIPVGSELGTMDCLEDETILRQTIKLGVTPVSSDLLPMYSEVIEKKQKKLIEQKKISQPSQIKTCGSTFKNISNEKKAWMLIKKAGCENFKEGDAIISQKHCNFFVNKGNANFEDMKKLINFVSESVFKKTGVKLETEIKILE